MNRFGKCQEWPYGRRTSKMSAELLARHLVGRASAVCSGLVLLLAISGTTTAIPVGAAVASENPSPQGWVAHSAYGLQLAVPRSWTVEYFQGCAHSGPGTLLIGTPSTSENCPFIPLDTNIVWMQPYTSQAAPVGQVNNLVVHGLHVSSYSGGDKVHWAVPSRHTLIIAEGSESSAVLHTLRLATPRAQPAPGVVNGTEYLGVVGVNPVTGFVSVTRLDAHGPGLPAVHAYDGRFSDTLPPGRYQLAGQAGNAQCTPITAVVQSGTSSETPEIYCTGK
jgi:hypothetical protein